MSYDLLVFEPNSAPRDSAEFMRWWEKLAEWGEGHDYGDPANTAPALREWYHEMRQDFPAMNGPDAASDEQIDDPKVSDYCIARSAIYVTFAWSVAEEADIRFRTLAEKHSLGFFDPSGEGEVWGPTADGGYAKWFVTGEE